MQGRGDEDGRNQQSNSWHDCSRPRHVEGPFQLQSLWTNDARPNLRLKVKKGEWDKWTAEVYAWPDKAEKPGEPLLKHDVTGLKGQGKCILWATPYSNTPNYFDDLHIVVEAAVAK